ncbi:20330_t:CDS:2, partial [Gigaspora margarita]
RMSSSVSSHMSEDDISSVNELYEYDEPPISGESPACKTKKRKKRDNSKKGSFTVCQICKNNNITVKYAHDSSTENMLGHLWTKHRIDKDHSEETNTNGSIVKAMHVITKRRQEKIAQLLVEFIIEDCQPFHILRNKAFRRLLNYMESGFQIPCEPTVKKMINKAYYWSRDQLFSMINMDGGYVNLTTDLWSSRTNQGYIGITVTWIDSNFELKEALLTIRLLPSPHTAEAIRDSLNQVIINWGLNGRVFCITTNNGANIKKAIGLMDNITRSSCSAHTLQLSVLKGLKPAVRLIK